MARSTTASAPAGADAAGADAAGVATKRGPNCQTRIARLTTTISVITNPGRQRAAETAGSPGGAGAANTSSGGASGSPPGDAPGRFKRYPRLGKVSRKRGDGDSSSPSALRSLNTRRARLSSPTTVSGQSARCSSSRLKTPFGFDASTKSSSITLGSRRWVPAGPISSPESRSARHSPTWSSALGSADFTGIFRSAKKEVLFLESNAPRR